MRDQLKNELELPIGFPLTEWQTALLPPETPMVGLWCRVEPIDPNRHAGSLFESFSKDSGNRIWTYLPYGPFETIGELTEWIRKPVLVVTRYSMS